MARRDLLDADCYLRSFPCEILSAEGFQQGFSSLPPTISEELFRLELDDCGRSSGSLCAEMKKVQKASINFDNSLSPARTLLQILCVDQKGFLYDTLRTLKDCSIKVLKDVYAFFVM